MTILWRYFPLLVATGIGLAGYWYVTNLQESVSDLVVKNSVLEQALETEKANVQTALNVNMRTQQELNDLSNAVAEMNTIQMKASEELERINDIFSKHNFGDLAQRKPGLIERRVNDGTANSIRLLECATGKKRSDC